MNCVEEKVSILRGSYVITVPADCYITTPKLTYKNKKGVIIEHLISLGEIKGVRLPRFLVKKLVLEKVSLDKLHQIQLQDSEEESLDVHFQKIYSRSSLGIISVVALLEIS
ncbi:unnamed protein product [Acanthoscelides obtectus]|uniref:Uncharacterized protein n=1 Tax=Acanthoscelides obtectus TaxID=200917 RepID=A0A9P0K658_ACAOB|nr:unnamed protein product [Acanthoscelides obtectus]CAK1655433.1 hypothetical protein AOBTE_LOCUS19174 [Acanthoscelides obtectus]